MRPLLLDTNVISELRKKPGIIDSNVLAWSRSVEIVSCSLCSVTIYELERGILLLAKKDHRQATLLTKWLDGIKNVEFKGRILPIDCDVASQAAALQLPNPMSLPDAFIAATALVNDLTLATRNIDDYLSTGVRLVNPWESGAPVLTDVSL